MNDLQKLIFLRGLTIKKVAERIGHGYHITQKVIKRTSLPLKMGGTYIYRSRDIETAVADLLGLSHGEAWGPESSTRLRQLIRQEVKKQAKNQAKIQEQELQNKWLHNSRIAGKKDKGNV